MRSHHRDDAKTMLSTPDSTLSKPTATCRGSILHTQANQCLELREFVQVLGRESSVSQPFLFLVTDVISQLWCDVIQYCDSFQGSWLVVIVANTNT